MYNDGHESYKDTWICDYCDKSHDKEEMMHHCGKCKYDFCEGCFTGGKVTVIVRMSIILFGAMFMLLLFFGIFYF